MKIQGKWVDGEVYLSLNTIKQILTTDLVEYLEDKSLIPNTTEYIKDLIERLDNIKTPEKKWWA